MKKVLIAVVVVVVLLVAAVAIVPQLVPLETYKAEIADQVRAATGRDLTIGGDIDIGVGFPPSIELEVAEVTLSNAPGGEAAAMATLSRLRLKLEVWPLLGGAVKVERFVLVDPVVHLEIDADGKPNWTFAAAEGAAPADAAQPTGQAAQPAEAGGGAVLADLKLGDVRIENGTVTYADATTGAAYRISEIDMMVDLPAFDQPLQAEGSLVYNQERVNLILEAVTPARIAAGKRADIAAEVESAALTLKFGGGVVAAPFSADGEIELDVPSIRKLAAWAGAPIEFAGSGLGPFRVKGTLAVDGDTYSFSNAEIALDDIAATGALAVDLGGTRPSVKARLDVAKLDLNPYLPPEAEGGTGTAGDGAQGTASSGATSSGAAPPPDWSDDPIDLSALRLADADLAFSAGSLAVRDVKIGPSALTVRLEAGDLVVDLGELELYGGSGAARIRVDARGEVPAVEKSIRIGGVQAEPLLRDAAGFDRLGGTLDAEMRFTAKGRSEREMVANLNGEGAVTFLDGAIKGINLGAMVRNLQGAFLGGADVPQQTDFAELSGTFRIDNGFLRNNDLALKAPLLRLRGVGTVEMPQRTLHYRVEPKIAATGEGQGGAADVAGLMVPVIVEGPWHDLSYKPDLSGLIEQAISDPGKLIEDAKGIEDTAKGLLKGILGGAAPAAEDQSGGEAPTQPVNPLDAIKSLFGN